MTAALRIVAIDAGLGLAIWGAYASSTAPEASMAQRVSGLLLFGVGVALVVRVLVVWRRDAS